MTSPLAGLGGAGGGNSRYASPGPGLDRLVRKEVALGTVRERPVPEDHVILSQIAPFLSVESDDVIFDYLQLDGQAGLSPARAEDAEAELAQADTRTYGQGRASLIDWSISHRTSPSDVTRYKDNLILQQAASGLSTGLNLNDPGRMAEQFQRKLARESAWRRRALDNRLEWLGWQQLENNGVTYNDGKISFTNTCNRPSDQHNVLATSLKSAQMYNQGTDFDPIGDIQMLNQLMYDRKGIRLRRAYASQKVLDSFWMSERFVAMAGIVVGGTPSSTIDLNYVTNGWTPEAALAKISSVTGVNFQVFDSVYRTRPLGGNTVTNNRFFSQDKIVFLPEEGDLGEVDDTEIGFAKTLTSPHPEGNWQSGFYEWEQDEVNPWQHVEGTGIKAFPIFPYMDWTFTLKVLA